MRMFACQRYVVDDYESIDSQIKNVIESNLTPIQLRHMINEPEKFSEEYFNFFLNVYCCMCKLSRLSYTRVMFNGCEPVEHFGKDDKLVHIFVMHIIVSHFNEIRGSNTCKVTKQQSAKDTKVQVQLLTGLNAPNHDHRLPLIPDVVADKLLTLVVLADHGAWHYYNRMLSQSNNTKLKDRADSNVHSHLQNKHVSLASLITSKPDYQVEKQMYDSRVSNMIIKTSRAHDREHYNTSGSDTDDDDGFNDSTGMLNLECM